ncbi:conserved hypothetical protein [Clostridium butyricum 5521]|uniref:Uncharacterized protein n=2 Tax=Clostridium butyricum TaxID=1492 RepID=C4ICR9_CLOBU|nr:conserved hypothetical protein [Clostridium butyricum 5521]EEP55888.1 conserved hypothetical protein [Clostridium butyricum E4 str. BoNT E BL5262]
MEAMIRTVVCKKDGCKGNEFYIVTEDNKLKLTCKECGNNYYYDVGHYDFTMLSNCERCNNDIFKVFVDLEKKGVMAKCTKCGYPPEKVFIDAEGIQVTYEAHLLQDIKQLMNQIDQRVCNLEMKIEGLEKGQELLEESLAYINRYMSERN